MERTQIPLMLLMLYSGWAPKLLMLSFFLVHFNRYFTERRVRLSRMKEFGVHEKGLVDTVT